MNIEEGGLLPEIKYLDLEMIKFKLQDSEDGVGWNNQQCSIAETQYKRFLTLNKLYPDAAIVPDRVIDTFWHYHILDTRKYHQDCFLIFGNYFHHYPYFGMKGDDDRQNLIDAYAATKQMFRVRFGVDLELESAACGGGSSQSCRNCVSSCRGR